MMLAAIMGMKCMPILCNLTARVGLYCKPWHTYQIGIAMVGLPDECNVNTRTTITSVLTDWQGNLTALEGTLATQTYSLYDTICITGLIDWLIGEPIIWIDNAIILHVFSPKLAWLKNYLSVLKKALICIDSQPSTLSIIIPINKT